VDWIYYNETISIIYNLDYDNWDSKVLEMLTKIKAEDYFYISTLKATVGNEFREYLFRVTVEFFCDLIERVAENANMGEEEIRFIAEFYAFGIVGVINSWAQKGMKETPEYITKQLRNLVNGTERFASVRYQIRNRRIMINVRSLPERCLSFGGISLLT
jgi:hypothetical protein